MKTLITFAMVLFSVTAFATTSAPGKKINCQYSLYEKVQVQLNLGNFGHFALFKSASMPKAERADIFSRFETPYEIVLDGYMPSAWPQGTTFRINLSKTSRFHDIVIDNPQGGFTRSSMTCNGQW